MKTTVLHTQRLLLRPFTPEDAGAVYRLLKEEETIRFLPMFALQNVEQAQAWIEAHVRGPGMCFAVCADGAPAGYVTLSPGPAWDLGYALAPKLRGRGFATEAAGAVAEEARRQGVPYLTATHDVNNLPSGAVMRRIGMMYRYSYIEQWQPKNVPVTFRMYQLNFALPSDWTYSGYWKQHPCHFLEPVDGFFENGTGVPDQ